MIIKKTRIFQLARELRISSEALMHIIESLNLGDEVKSHMASVDADTVAKIKDHFQNEKAAVKEAQRRKVRIGGIGVVSPVKPAPRAVAPTPAPPAPPQEVEVKAPPPPSKASVPPVKHPAPQHAKQEPRTKVRPTTRPRAPMPPPTAVQPPTSVQPAVASAPKRPKARPEREVRPPMEPRPVQRDISAGEHTGRSAPAPARGRGKKKKKKKAQVDQAAVRQSVKKTLATMDTTRRRTRKRRRDDGEPVLEEEILIIQIEEFATVAELAGAMDASPAEVIAACLQLGIIANINRRLDKDSIEAIADEFGYQVKFHNELAQKEVEKEEVVDVPWSPRPPIVTVVGHVDHGKTSLLDYIRKTNVIAQESGAITQHIGASDVHLKQGRVVFLDTPGHEAFTAMRARGVQLTDIVVLVVAADDRVNEQTIEAINHARAANVPIVVAINKCDLPNANPDRIKKELADQNLLVEEWGGKVVAVEISAKKGDNVDKLMEMILLVSELLELKAQPTRKARGVVIEAKRERGRGIVASILVGTGTLHVGDPFVCGSNSGRVRAMHDDHGERVNDVPPATPVEVLGWSDLPMAGDILSVTATDDEARSIASRRSQIQREYQMRQRRPTLLSLQEKIRQGEMAELKIVLKGDVAGSVEVLRETLEHQSTEKVALRIVHAAVGSINESDVNLALASEAVIIGFQVRPEPRARSLAEESKIDIRLYSVIHEVIDDIRDAMAGKLKPKRVEKILGEAEIREVFYISKFGYVAGSYVTSGSVARQSRARVLRDSEQVFDGRIRALKRFKEDVREVTTGYECGISLEGFTDFKENDKIQVYEVEEVAAELE
ncbi:MAG: translation initiation factor IF-2 [Candidatus Eisenbacteria bacterium]|uniref:Translation initiation factor IF-2 n=1 Tax=Eiseniibacteriota bacterium TaxID=2212470 RepID=A0A948RV98_UNCEI|nr:translation initiation factor IF-2 [Candidatus Eisenbacteria bacterium]MBU1951197.1 translation initiation factor IF-2 [Candidatus Eisenbacteria bacterium]MBU2690616.1 translation initiation factor IF-2 [Candidatus Eisenbacteria bacterium]